MRRLSASLLLLLLVSAIAACALNAAPAGPGTATFDILGRRTECGSLHGCAWVAKLTGPNVLASAVFDDRFGNPEVGLAPGFPQEIADGTYDLEFEIRLLSDGGTFHVPATCGAQFTVGGGRWVVKARVNFDRASCSVNLALEPAT